MYTHTRTMYDFLRCYMELRVEADFASNCTLDPHVLVEFPPLLIDTYLLHEENAPTLTTIVAFTGSVNRVHALFESAYDWFWKDRTTYNVPMVVIRATESRMTFAIVSLSCQIAFSITLVVPSMPTLIHTFRVC